MLRILIVCFIMYPTIEASFDIPAIYQLTDPVEHGEGPTWDARKNILFFVDLHQGRVYSLNYNTTAVNSIKLNGDVAPVVPSKNNSNLLIVGLNRSIVAVEWDGTNQIGKQKVLSTVSNQFAGSRFNDGKADKEGRLWFGTVGAQDLNTGDVQPDQGIFYKVTKDNLANPSVEIAPVNISNGLAWNAANDKLYYVDSSSLQVAEYDYNNVNGTIANRRVVFDLANHPTLGGIPDGMTIDEDDNLWIALFGGGSVIKVSPKDGQILQTVAIPAKGVTSAIWGGPTLDILFVTTSRQFLSDAERLFFPAAGSVFGVTNLKTKGKEVFNADIVDSI